MGEGRGGKGANKGYWQVASIFNKHFKTIDIYRLTDYHLLRTAKSAEKKIVQRSHGKKIKKVFSTSRS